MGNASTPNTGDAKLAYTVNEFIKAFGISRASIYELIKNGELHTVKVAGRRLIPRSSAMKLLEPAPH